MNNPSTVFNRLADYAEELENEVEVLDAIVENLDKVVENMRDDYINLKQLVHDYCVRRLCYRRLCYCVCLDEASEKDLFNKLCESVGVSTSEIE